MWHNQIINGDTLCCQIEINSERFGINPSTTNENFTRQKPVADPCNNIRPASSLGFGNKSHSNSGRATSAYRMFSEEVEHTLETITINRNSVTMKRVLHPTYALEKVLSTKDRTCKSVFRYKVEHSSTSNILF
jgi:hypothetical protein